MQSPARIKRGWRAWVAVGITPTLALALAAGSGVSANGQSALPSSSPPVSVSAPTTSAGQFTAATLAAPGSDPLGVPYEDWASRWWSWLMSSPAAVNPGLTDACDAGQGPEAFFIPQTFPGIELAVTCHAAAGQPVLVSPGGSICTPDAGETEEDVAACVANSDATLFAPSVTVDGQPIADIGDWFVMSEPFELMLPEDNLFGIPAGPVSGVLSSGWFVMLSDLAPGTHTIVLHDETTDPATGNLVAELTATVEVATE